MFQKSLSTNLFPDRTNATNVFHYYYSVEGNGVSVVCRRNLFRGKKQIKGKKEERARLARLLKDFRDCRRGGVEEIGKKKSRLEQGVEKIQTEKLCPREAEFIVCRRSISPASSSSSSSFTSPPPSFPAVGTLWSRRKYLNDIFFLPRYPSYYEVRITRAVYVPGAPGPP